MGPSEALERATPLTAPVRPDEHPRTWLTRHDGRPGAGEVSRIGGLAVGVSAERWPRWQGLPMAHVITLDLRQVALPYVPRNRAVAVFAAASLPGEPEGEGSAVLLLTEEDVAAGEGSPPGAPVLPASRLLPARIPQSEACYFGHQPRFVSEDPILGDGLELGEILARAASMGAFVMQFDETLVPLDLGESGVMYVFQGTAFVQR